MSDKKSRVEKEEKKKARAEHEEGKKDKRPKEHKREAEDAPPKRRREFNEMPKPDASVPKSKREDPRDPGRGEFAGSQETTRLLAETGGRNTYLMVSDTAEFNRIINNKDMPTARKFDKLFELMPHLRKLGCSHTYKPLSGDSAAREAKTQAGMGGRMFNVSFQRPKAGPSFWQSFVISSEPSKKDEVLFTAAVITDKSGYLNPREAKKGPTPDGRWAGPDAWRNNKDYTAGLKVYMEAHYMDVPFRHFAKATHPTGVNFQEFKYHQGFGRVVQVWTTTPSLDPYAMVKPTYSSGPCSVLPSPYCLSIIKYTITCTESLGNTDKKNRENNVVNSTTNLPIRDGASVEYVTNPPSGEKPTTIAPKINLKGYHDIIPLTGFPQSLGNLSDKPDSKETTQVGMSESFINLLSPRRTFRFGDSNEMRRSVADADSIGPIPSGSNVAERAKMFKRHLSIYSTDDGEHYI